MERVRQQAQQVHQEKDAAAAAAGGDAEQSARRPHYGTTGLALPPHPTSAGLATASGRGVRRGPRRAESDGRSRLIRVPEGDEETDEGWEGDQARGLRQAQERRRLPTVQPRMFFSLLALPVLVPLVLIGPRLGKDALKVPAAIPAHQWQWLGFKAVAAPSMVRGAHLAQISQDGLKKLSAKQVQLDAKDLGKAVSDAVAKGGGDDLLRTFGTAPKSDEAMVVGPSGPEAARMQQTQQGAEILRAGRTSIWNYGPFVFTLGVMISILAKMLIAQPLAKVGTDVLLMWAGTQEQAHDSEQYYGYVYLERDEEFGGPSPRSAGSAPKTRISTPTVHSSRTHASEAVTPRRSTGDPNGSMQRDSVDSKRSSSGKKKWPVTLDLPEHGASASFGTSRPQPVALNGGGASALPARPDAPLPVLSPDSALTSPGETIISQLDDSRVASGAQV